MARAIRAHCLASGQSSADIALIIYGQCGPAFGTTLVRAHRLAQGIALADVVFPVAAGHWKLDDAWGHAPIFARNRVDAKTLEVVVVAGEEATQTQSVGGMV